MSLVAADPATARSHFLNRPFALTHSLSDHPLFSLSRLIELAKSLPRDHIEYSSGQLAPNTAPEDVPTLDMPAETVIERIETANAWMVIKSVEDDPAYDALLRDFVLEAHRIAGRPETEPDELQGFIFVSSANSVTPFHFDAEENILIQIRGDKYAHIFDNSDRSLVGEAAMEISPSKHRNQPYREEFEQRAEVFTMKEGDGVHIPYTWPHWIRTGDRYSISMAMTWKTAEVRRLNKIRLMNGTMRHFRLPQAAPGVAPLRDRAKIAAHDMARAVIDPIRKNDGARRMLRGLIYGRNANYYLKTAKKTD